jgi:branched-chain amino acid transport system ATP-binding protein
VYLRIDEIHTFIGGTHILHGVSLQMAKGDILALLGRNGVGKSTTLKSIMGLTPPQEGSIRFKGEQIGRLRPYKICRLGVGYIPEERRIFSNLTVKQNLLIAIKPKQQSLDNPWTLERVYFYFPRLKEREGQKGGLLSGGEQQMLTIGRTLMGNPELLLVDEPTEGLSPLLVEEVVKIIQQINENGHSILLVTQALDVGLNLANHVCVMSKGEIVFRGTGEELKAEDKVRKKYLEV